MSAPTIAWGEPDQASPSTVDTPHSPEAYGLEVSLRSLVFLAAVTSPRARQTSLGGSEAGHACDRRIAYRLAGTPIVNLRDPLRSIVGIGFHAAMAELFTRLDAGSGRFLVEVPVAYRGIPGTVDLYDRHERTVIDWKTKLSAKLRKVRHEGPSTSYVTQTMLYAAALREQGEDVRHVALAFVPVDATDLSGMYVWRAPFDKAIADAAVDRIERLRGRDPSTVEATPDRLCPWCSQYRPGSTDLRVGCPGGAS